MANVTVSQSVGTRIESIDTDVKERNYSFSVIKKFVPKKDFREINFHKSHIVYFLFENIDIENTDFSFAKLNGGKIKNVNIANSNFIYTDLRRVQFRDVIFTDCNLSFSDLRGTEFMYSHVGNTIFDGALFNNSTILPFSRAEAMKRGMIFSNDRGER